MDKRNKRDRQTGSAIGKTQSPKELKIGCLRRSRWPQRRFLTDPNLVGCLTHCHPDQISRFLPQSSTNESKTEAGELRLYSVVSVQAGLRKSWTVCKEVLLSKPSQVSMTEEVNMQMEYLATHK
ncbi:hypothetical protein AOLI_G00201770 [Acnodon oligacanthus]